MSAAPDDDILEDNNDNDDDARPTATAAVEPPTKKRRRRKRQSTPRRPGTAAVPSAARRREHAAARVHSAQEALAAALAVWAPQTLHAAWAAVADGRVPPTPAAAHHTLAATLAPLLAPAAGAAPVAAHRQAAAYAAAVLAPCARAAPLARLHAALLLLRAWSRGVPEQLMACSSSSSESESEGEGVQEWGAGAHGTLGSAELVAWAAGLRCARVLRAVLRAVLAASTVPRARAEPVVAAAVRDIHSVSSSLVLAYHDSAAHRDFCAAVARVRDVFAPDDPPPPVLSRVVSPPPQDGDGNGNASGGGEDAGYGARVARAARGLVRDAIREGRGPGAVALAQRLRADPLRLVADLAAQERSARRVLFADAPAREDEAADAARWMDGVQRVCVARLRDGGDGESDAEDAQRLVDTLAHDGTAALLRRAQDDPARVHAFCDAVADYAAPALAAAATFRIGSEDLLQRLLGDGAGEEDDAPPQLQAALNRVADNGAPPDDTVRALVRCALFSRRAVVRGVLALAWHSSAPGVVDTLARPLLRPLLAHDAAAQHTLLAALRDLVLGSTSSTGSPAARLAALVTALDGAALVPRRALTAWLVATFDASDAAVAAAAECAAPLFAREDPATRAAVRWLVQRGTCPAPGTRDAAQAALAAFVAQLGSSSDDDVPLDAQLLLHSFAEPLPPPLCARCVSHVAAAAAHPLRTALRLAALAGANARALAAHLRAAVVPREPPVLALAAVLAGASAREFAACVAAAPFLVATDSETAAVPQLLFQAFWFAHQDSTRTLFRDTEQQLLLPACLCGTCDATPGVRQEGPARTCTFLAHLVHALQTAPCATAADALACHRSACLLHRHCSACPRHRLATRSLCVATQRTALAHHAAPADLRALHQQCGVATDAELSALLETALGFD